MKRVLVFFFLLWMSCASAAEIRMTHSYEITEPVQHDLYVFANTLTVKAPIHGNLIFVGSSLEVDADISGSVTAICIESSMRSSIGKNSYFVAVNSTFYDTFYAAKTIDVFAKSVRLEGEYDGKVNVSSTFCLLNGSFHEEVGVDSKDISVDNLARFSKKAILRSSHPPEISSSIEGESNLSYEKTWSLDVLLSPSISWISSLFSLILSISNYLFSLVIGWVFFLFEKKHMHKYYAELSHHYIKNFFVGFLILTLVPIFSLLLFVSVLGIPFALTLIALNVMGFYSAKVIVIFWIIHLVLPNAYHNKKMLIYFYFPAFLALYFVLRWIPILSSIVAVVFLLEGIGAFFSATLKMRHHTAHSEH